jgi:polar amino acid transport system permease protein
MALCRRFLTAKSILTGLEHHRHDDPCDGAGHRAGRHHRDHAAVDQPGAAAVAQAYVWLFRGTPVILQLLLWFNLALVFPVDRHTWPLRVSHRRRHDAVPRCAARARYQPGAYTSEVVRAGLLSVDTGQYEAAKSIGMPRLQALRRVILPQAMRVIVPPIGNELVGMVKLTSLASVIQYAEMLHNAENIYYANARVIELLMVAGVWYLVVVTVLSLLQSRVELRFARGAGRPSAAVNPALKREPRQP